MRSLLFSLGALVPFVASPSEAKENCPLYGPLFPRPTNLIQDATIKAVASTLDNVFVEHIDNDTSTGSERYSYAVEVFTGSEDKPLWAHYWTAPSLKNFNSTGVSKVDGNTVFRIGSVTKIFTVLTFLATVGDGIWNDPITKHLPEIEEISRNASGNPILTTDWESITVGSLANALLGELSYQINLTNLYDMGFPPLNASEYPPCGTWPTCDRKQLFAGLAKLPPSFPPFVTATYSDIGFVLLSYVAERITGKDFKTLVRETVLEPLSLKHTFVEVPEDSLGIIPGTSRSKSWGFQLAEESATGNMYSSSGDMASLGRAILRSTLLKPAMTRRWLKPSSFSSDPKALVGMPWGIRRIQLAKNQTYQFVHTFNKVGSLGAYSSLLAIIPELDIGFSVLAAGDAPAGLTTAIAETLADTYVPTLSYLARAQANATFAGHYRHASLLSNNSTSVPQQPPFANTTTTTTTPPPYSNGSSSSSTSPPPLPLLNSSLTITIDQTAPGLGVTGWLSNGTDMARLAVAINNNVSAAYLDRLSPSVRLYPTGLEDLLVVTDSESASTNNTGAREGKNKKKRVAFKAVFEDIAPAGLEKEEEGLSFVTDCATWVGVTAVVYASKPLDLFVFEFDMDGKVVAVVNEALRVRLEKVDDHDVDG
ncbi:beta-lactamase/transpeptidase-like protein [Chaetomium strumarium]|uniref:Beta-lactamase/transpeptidase-like protein n=1 Tax=Chaetomium strumarium TaxID=1170767 RepID=A0AAJ0M4D7_9PEZI|nr:beta-lactamase/transpeptidase-like protein [Chaetomium strumarium]